MAAQLVAMVATGAVPPSCVERGGSAYPRIMVLAFAAMETRVVMADKVKVIAELSPEIFNQLTAIAAARGIDANTALEQAIGTEKLFVDNVGKDDEVVIHKPGNRLAKFVFGQ